MVLVCPSHFVTILRTRQVILVLVLILAHTIQHGVGQPISDGSETEDHETTLCQSKQSDQWVRGKLHGLQVLFRSLVQFAFDLFHIDVVDRLFNCRDKGEDGIQPGDLQQLLDTGMIDPGNDKGFAV